MKKITPELKQRHLEKLVSYMFIVMYTDNRLLTIDELLTYYTLRQLRLIHYCLYQRGKRGSEFSQLLLHIIINYDHEIA